MTSKSAMSIISPAFRSNRTKSDYDEKENLVRDLSFYLGKVNVSKLQDHTQKSPCNNRDGKLKNVTNVNIESILSILSFV